MTKHKILYMALGFLIAMLMFKFGYEVGNRLVCNEEQWGDLEQISADILQVTEDCKGGLKEIARECIPCRDCYNYTGLEVGLGKLQSP